MFLKHEKKVENYIKMGSRFRLVFFLISYYRVTHLKVPLLQQIVYRVYEVFGVILIIFTKYGL